MSGLLRNFAQNALSCGSSSTHGGHHVAQKWTSTTFPFSFDRLTLFPSRVKTSSFEIDERDVIALAPFAGGLSEVVKTNATLAVTASAARRSTVRVFIRTSCRARDSGAAAS